MSLDCTCADFVPNVQLINAPFVLAAARNPDKFRGYEGKKFKYCPWCGKELPRVQPEELEASCNG